MQICKCLKLYKLSNIFYNIFFGITYNNLLYLEEYLKDMVIITARGITLKYVKKIHSYRIIQQQKKQVNYSRSIMDPS